MVYLKQFINDLKNYWWYCLYSVKTNLKVELSNTILGYFWWILDPLIHMFIYSFLVIVVFNHSIENFQIYVFCALLPWKFTSSLLQNSTNCIRVNGHVIKQIYLPKFLLPLIIAMTNFIKLFFGICMLVFMAVLLGINISIIDILWLIPVLILYFIFYYSLSLLLTHIGIFIKDFSQLIGYLIMLWFFLSPAIWNINNIPVKYHNLLKVNPNYTFFTSIRNCIMYQKKPLLRELTILFILSVFILIINIYILYKNDKYYGKMV